MKEIWKKIKGYEGLYYISTLGRVRREKTNNNTWEGKILTPHENGYGYLKVVLFNPTRKNVYIHKLMMENFTRIRPNGLQINHKDSNKKNNLITNLEYITHRANVLHSFKSGIRNVPKGENHYKSKLNNKKVIWIRKNYEKSSFYGKNCNWLAKKFGVSAGAIQAIISRKKWKHII